MMDQKFIIKTNINTNGNYKTLIIDTVRKVYKKDYNTRDINPFNIEVKGITQKELNNVIEQLKKNDYIEID